MFALSMLSWSIAWAVMLVRDARASIFSPALRISASGMFAETLLIRVICPPLSGPETMIVWTTKGTTNAEQEAQAGRDYRQAA